MENKERERAPYGIWYGESYVPCPIALDYQQLGIEPNPKKGRSMNRNEYIFMMMVLIYIAALVTLVVNKLW